MYQGRYSERANTAPVRKGTAKRRRLRWSKQFAVLACVAVLLTGFVGSSLAWLMDSTTEVKNEFVPGHVTPVVTEDFDGSVKSDVKIQNTGNVDAYIRAKLVFTWQNKAGEVLGVAPTSNDYTISWTNEGWKKGSDGYYYYTTPVAPGGSTEVLATNIEQVSPNPAEDYTLHVEVLAESIQAEPSGENGAAHKAWGVDPAKLG